MAAGDIQQNNSLGNITALLTLLKGTPTNTQSTTSSENVSDAKAAAYLQSILESNSGLAAVSSGQKNAGMYGSTVNTQLTNDLLARAAAQTAALSASKTTTTTNKTAAQVNPLKTLAAAGLNSLLGPAIKAGIKKAGVNKWGDQLSDSIFGSSGSAFADTTPATIQLYSPSTVTPVDTAAISDISNLNVSSSSGGSSVGSLAAAGLGAEAFSSFSAGAGLADTSYAIGGTGTFMTSAGGSTAAAEVGAGEAAGMFGGSAGAAGSTALESGGLGAVALNDMLNLKQTYDSGDPWQWAGTLFGGPQGGPVVKAIETGNVFDALGPTGGITENIVKGWIICTELNKQGRLPSRWYVYGAKEFAKYDERGKQGYYIWAIPSVRHLRKHPNSLYSKLMEVVFNVRAEYLSAKAGCRGARKTVLGAITNYGLYAFCWTLSRTIARKSYTQDQILNVGV